MTTKQWKSRLALLLVGIMACVIFAACSSNGQNNEPATPTPGTNTPDNAAAEEPKERGSITVSVYDRGTVPAEEGTMDNNRWTKWINENGPVDVSFVSVPRWESQQKFNVMFASKSAPDLIMEYDTAYRNQLYNQQLIMPVDELIENSTNYKAMLEEYPALRKVTTKEDGKMYEFARVIGLQPNHALFIRADWLEALNIEVPQTTEELFEVAKAFKEQDPDGNGADDTYGMALSYISGMIVDYMHGSVFTMFEKQPWYPDANGELIHDWDRVQAAAEYKKRLFDAGLVDRDFLTDSKGEKAKQDFINGKLGIWGTSIGDFPAYETLKQNNPDARIQVIALPESEFGQFSPVLYNPVQSVAAVNVMAKNPQAIMEYVDFMVDPETKKVFDYGIEGEHHTVENGCPKLIETDEVKAQLSYKADLMMMFSTDFTNECADWWNYNESNATPLQLEYKDIRYDAVEAYVSQDRPNPAITSSEHMPLIPEDLQINQQNGFKAVEDILTRAIIGGTGYTVEQAIGDAKAAWNKSNGEKIDQWYADWYRDNKDSAFLMNDMYDLAQDVFFRP
ncbi:extracellular solute-binding protein [Paenibacillus daejeonensis]|uniref:extracellular solute-binding protein n=1 Tax=Paenibacillus daejeonensis TaxID=135193 RepID=UPI00037F7386|nr:extracellular solute-binding protein [Paenibacillus daejeonensis]